MTYLEVMQAAFEDELTKIAEDVASAEKAPAKLTRAEGMLAMLGGGPGGYYGAKKAREHGHDALEGGLRGYGG
jgi:hypothetical protein